MAIAVKGRIEQASGYMDSNDQNIHETGRYIGGHSVLLKGYDKLSDGHLWQGRFYSCLLDELHLYAAIRYIENNPVRARLAKSAIDWDWSSARHHVTGEKSIVSLVDTDKYIKIDDWEDYLAESDKPGLIRKIKANTLTGRPLGNDEFVTRIERIFHMRLRPLGRGRPRKEL